MESKKRRWRSQHRNDGKKKKTQEALTGISGLPGSVLCHILSFLPTKTCVGTSFLSRRWRYLWEHLQVLEFCDFSGYGSFITLVNGVLAHRKTHDIRKLRLWGGNPFVDTLYVNSFATWVRTAIGPHLEELSVTLASTQECIVVPLTLFTCPNLVSLRFGKTTMLLLTCVQC